MNFGPTRKGAASEREEPDKSSGNAGGGKSIPEEPGAVRHEAYRCNGQWSHSPFQVGDGPLERSGRGGSDGERAAPKRPGEVRDRPPRRQVGKAIAW